MPAQHPPSCLCADCLASVPHVALPSELAYEPLPDLLARLRVRLAPEGVLPRLSTLDGLSYQCLAFDPADGSVAGDCPCGVARSDVGAVEAFADALDLRAERATQRAPLARSLAEAFPAGVTLSVDDVDALVSELVGRRAAGGA